MLQQTKLDHFFTIKKMVTSTKIESKDIKSLNTPELPKKRNKSPFNASKSPGNLKNTPVKKRKTPTTESSLQKISKIDSPSEKIVRIFPSSQNVSHSNENSPQKLHSFSPARSQSESPLQSPEKGKKLSSFSLKKSPRSASTSKHTAHFSPRNLFGGTENSEEMQKAIENLNLAKQGAVGPNNFDLEKIYQRGKWDINYKPLRTDAADEYEIKDVIVPKEKHADHLFTMIIDVFSNIINCGYFDERELDFMFSALTLSARSQMLLARLLKRKRSWYRTSRIKYEKIANNLEEYFRELTDKGFCLSNIETEEISNLLQLLQVDEVSKLCQKFKVDRRKLTKDKLTENLVQLSKKQTSWFVGAKSPNSALRSSIIETLGPCICLSSDSISLFDRVFTLLIPCQDPAENVSDLFLTLTRVKSGEILFPSAPKERFPIFKDRDHLLGFIEAQNALRELLKAAENKDWKTVRKTGHLAYERLFPCVEDEEESYLPSHVKKFLPLSVWTKVLSKSIEAFKKTPETMEDAVKYLRALLQQDKYGKSYLGRWYKELSLIEMHHRKDLQTSATLTLQALSQENLTEVDVMDLLERAKKLMRRKTGIENEIKTLMSDVLETLLRELPAEFDVINEIEAHMVLGNVSGSKSTWSVDIGEEAKGYTRVENIALRHYYQEGYPKGFHCEGSLPLTLFTVLFWTELYDTAVPGAFVSVYQESPLDLYTSKFYDNRKTCLENKIKFIRALDDETFANLLEDDFIKYKAFKSPIANHLFETENCFKEVAMCLGTTGVAGICEKLASNFNLWKAGFPDLFVWNPLTLACKIVEVKGPGDSLSSKQKLWLQYLRRIGIQAEVCIVKAKGKSGRKY